MKKILLTTICLAFATFSFSQQLSRYVVSSAMGFPDSGFAMSFSEGFAGSIYRTSNNYVRAIRAF
jgi:hypothetical protein